MNKATRHLPQAILRRAKNLATALKEEERHDLYDEIAREAGITGDSSDTELVGPRLGIDGVHPFDATQNFATAMYGVLCGRAEKNSKPRPVRAKFNLAFATPSRIRQLWEARRAIDGIGIGYLHYLECAVQCWEAGGSSREPTPGQLTSVDCIAYVLERHAYIEVSNSHRLNPPKGEPSAGEKCEQI